MFIINTKHLSERNVSYISHAQFALGVCLRLCASSAMYLLHATFPFIQVPDALNLESMSIYLFDKNIEVED